MKRVTITYTRADSNTPWFWQVNNSTLSPMRDFIAENLDKISQSAVISGNENIVVLEFSDNSIYEQFAQFIDTNIKSDYVSYCEDNNITIETVTEEI